VKGGGVKLIIAGGRKYVPRATDEAVITAVVQAHHVDEIVSGGSGGADAMGENYGKAMGIRVSVYPAKWGTHGKKAGPIRNREMARYADVCLLFPGGAGTADMKRAALAMNLTTYVVIGGALVNVRYPA
jgi:hypothetical protein